MVVVEVAKMVNNLSQFNSKFDACIMLGKKSIRGRIVLVDNSMLYLDAIDGGFYHIGTLIKNDNHFEVVDSYDYVIAHRRRRGNKLLDSNDLIATTIMDILNGKVKGD